MKMEADLNRFHRIVRGKIKQELKKFVSSGDLVARQGKKQITVALPRIELPKFAFGDGQGSGVGQGEGEVGDTTQDGQPQPGQGEAGDTPGEHSLEVDVTLDELADMLSEELMLPNIEEKGQKSIKQEHIRYSGITRQGPESLHHFRRTFKEALKRSIASGEYDPEDPIVIPIRDDKRYRSYSVVQEPVANAVMIYMMDVSGSMGDEQK
ncbi:MAG: DUF444 family protein, partial [Zetaproteobacteria bacterium]|nr:DUF444 family protein [Zetaproteobacteria bacterium]